MRGKAAHAGIDFEAGASAIVELAKQIARLTEFTDLKKGLTVNPGVISGGTRTNVVASEARAEVDVRVTRAKGCDAAPPKVPRVAAVRHALFAGSDGRLEPSADGALAGDHSPVPDGEEASQRHIWAGNSKKVQPAAGRTATSRRRSAVPTLDGIGAVGEGAHASHESILEDRIADRVALLALLVRHLGQ